MPKKSRKKPDAKSKTKSKKVTKPKAKPKKTKNPKQTTRRIPARVGERSRANITEVVAPSGSRGGVGAYNRRRTPQEIKAEREAQARATLGISDFPQPTSRAQTRQAPQKVRAPVGGFTGLTSGFGIESNKTKQLETAISDMESRLRNEIQKQNQPSNVRQLITEIPRNEPNIRRDINGNIIGLRLKGQVQPEPTEDKDTQTERDLQRSQRKARERNKRTRPEIFTPLPVTEEDENKDKEERRIQDIRAELERQTKAENIRIQKQKEAEGNLLRLAKKSEAQSTITRILKEANDKVKEKERLRLEPFKQAKKLYEDKQKQKEARKGTILDFSVDIPELLPDRPEPEPDPFKQAKKLYDDKQKEKQETPNFVVGGEGGTEVPFKSQEELLEAFRNRPNQPEPLTDESDFESDENTDEGTPRTAQEEFDEDFEDVLEIQPSEPPKPLESNLSETDRTSRTAPTSQRTRVQPSSQNLLNVGSLRKDISDSFGSKALFKLREEQAERDKTKEEFGSESLQTLRREQAERERLRTRPLPPTPERKLPVPPPFRQRTPPDPDRAGQREIIDDVTDRAFDKATARADELEKARKEQQRQERVERERVARGFIQSSLERGIRGAVDTQERRDRGSVRAQRDRDKRSAIEVGDIVDDLVDKSIVKAEAEQARRAGQGRARASVESVLRKYRSDRDPTNPNFDENIRKFREALEQREVILNSKEQLLNSLFNFGLNGRTINFNARDLTPFRSQKADVEMVNRIQEIIRNTDNREVQRNAQEIIDIARRFIQLKKDDKNIQNKIAKLRKK